MSNLTARGVAHADARARYLRPATTSRNHSSVFIIMYSAKLSNTSVTHFTVATLISREPAVDRQVRAVRLKDFCVLPSIQEEGESDPQGADARSEDIFCGLHL